MKARRATLAPTPARYKQVIRQQAATADILKVISKSRDGADPVFKTIARHAVRLCGAVFCNVLRFDGEMLHIAAHHGFSRRFLDRLHATYPMKPDPAQLSGRVMQRRAVVHIADALADTRYDKSYAAAGGWRRMLGVPMIAGESVLGVIVVAWKDTGRRPRAQVDLLRTFADQAVIAIENVRLFNETKEALEQQTATSSILGVISSSPTDLQPVFDAILGKATALCEAHLGLLHLYEGEKFRTVAHRGDRPEYEKWVLGRASFKPEAFLTELVAKRKPVHIADIRDTPSYRAGKANAVKMADIAGARSFLAVPLLKEGQLVGSITIYRPDVRPFTDKQIALVSTFADQAVIAIENVRLFNETKEALERQTATAEILRVIASSPNDVQPVFEVIVASAVRLCGARFGRVYRYDGSVIQMVASHGLSASGLGEVQRVFPRPAADDTIVGRAILTRLPFFIKDIEHEGAVPAVSRQMIKALGTRSQVTIPMLRAGEPIGAITMGWDEPGAFDDQQVTLLQTFADQAVIAIENVRLFKELEARNKDLGESLEQQTATGEILGVISASLSDIQPALDVIVRNAARLCETEYVDLLLRDGDVLKLAASHGLLPTAAETRPIRRTLVTGRVVMEGRPIYIADLQAVLDEFPDVPRRPGITIRTLLCIPLMRKGVAIGVLQIRRTEVRPLTDKQMSLVQTFADQAVIAIENVRLFKELEARNKDLGESLERQTATSEVLKVISRTTIDLEPVLQIVLDNARRLCDADRVTIFRPDANGDYVPVAAAAPEGMPRYMALGVVQRRPIRLDRTSATGRAIVDGRTVHIPDVLADPDYDRIDIAQASGFRTVLAVPMLRDRVPIGVLGLARSGEPRPFTDKQVELVTTFADQAVIAIENVRLFNEIQEKTRQVETANRHKSEFLANMSHELRTPLNAIIGFSEVLMEKMFGEVNEKQADYLKDIYESGKHLLSLINDILDLSKIEAGHMELDLASFHLPTAISNAMTLVRERAQRHGIQLGLDVDARLGDFNADERKVKQILLNLLSNAVKFTPEGGRVEVSAKLDTTKVEIAVRDTGCGISAEDQSALFEEFKQVGKDATRKAEGTGLGLALTKRFVELHGGEIRVDSAPGKGSTFTVTLPVRQ